MADSKGRDEAALKTFLAQLQGPRRRDRQEAAHMIEAMAKTIPDVLITYANDLIEVLERPEAQTRWEILDALSELLKVDAEAVAGAFDGAEDSLFDDSSAIVRLSAFKFLARFGASAPERSDQVWPLLDEAIQCYHGDPEYHDMLVALLEFAHGDISDAAAHALAARVRFDTKGNTRGYIRSFSTEIVDTLGIPEEEDMPKKKEPKEDMNDEDEQDFE